MEGKADCSKSQGESRRREVEVSSNSIGEIARLEILQSLCVSLVNSSEFKKLE